MTTGVPFDRPESSVGKSERETTRGYPSVKVVLCVLTPAFPPWGGGPSRVGEGSVSSGLGRVSTIGAVIFRVSSTRRGRVGPVGLGSQFSCRSHKVTDLRGFVSCHWVTRRVVRTPVLALILTRLCPTVGGFKDTRPNRRRLLLPQWTRSRC